MRPVLLHLCVGHHGTVTAGPRFVRSYESFKELSGTAMAMVPPLIRAALLLDRKILQGGPSSSKKDKPNQK